MVLLTDAQLAEYRTHGFLIVPNFLTAAETRAAQEGFFAHFAPRWQDRAGSGEGGGAFGANGDGILIFPWDSTGLNAVCVHPDLIDACERVIGTKRIRLCEAHCGMKYAASYGAGTTGGTAPDFFHQDFGNNSLGPARRPAEDDFQHVAGFYCLDDVEPGMAPIQMLSNRAEGKIRDARREAVPMVVPAGSLCLYSIYTRHAASDWDVARWPTGHRPAMWVSFCNAESNRLWDGGRWFSIKGSQIYRGHFKPPPRDHGGDGRPRRARLLAPSGPARAFGRALMDFSPRQRAVAFLLPEPGDPLWTEDFTARFSARWPGFDRRPYDEARPAAPDALERVLGMVADGSLSVAEGKSRIAELLRGPPPPVSSRL